MSTLLQAAVQYLVGHPEQVVETAGLVLGLILGKLAWTAVRKRRVALAVYYGFHIAKDIEAEVAGTPSEKTVDVVVLALKHANDWMVANGWRPLKGGEQDVAVLQARALSGKVATATGVAAASSPASPK
jgi:hypothetical protein